MTRSYWLAGVWALFLLCAGDTAGALKEWRGLDDNAAWETPQNWSGESLPGPGDDVVISGRGGNIFIESEARLASLSVGPGYALYARSAGTVLAVSGASSLTGAGLQASAGARVELSGATTWDAAAHTNRTFLTAYDSGTELIIANLTRFTAASFPWETAIDALNGSQITLGGEFEVNGGFLWCRAIDPGSIVRLPGLRKLRPAGVSLVAERAGQLEVPDLEDFSGTGAINGGMAWRAAGANSVLRVSGLANFTGCPFPFGAMWDAGDGGRVEVSGDFSVTGGRVQFFANGTNSVIAADGLAGITPAWFEGDARFGGRIQFPALRRWSGANANRANCYWTALGTNGVIDLPALDSVIGSPLAFSTVFNAYDGGRLNLGGSFRVDAGGIGFRAQGTNAVLSAPGLVGAAPQSFFAEAADGGALDLANLGDFSAASLGWDAATFVSRGNGSRLTAALTNFTGCLPGWFCAVEAIDDGLLRLSGEFPIRGGYVQLRSSGQLELPGLRAASPAGFDIYVFEGGSAVFANFEEYSGEQARQSVYWRAEDAGSRLEFPRLRRLVPSPLPPFQNAIGAFEGGVVVLSELAEVSGIAFDLFADGAGSRLELPVFGAVKIVPGRGGVRAQNGAVITLAPIFFSHGSYLEGLAGWGGLAITNFDVGRELLSGSPGNAALVEWRPIGDANGTWQTLARIPMLTNHLDLRSVLGESRNIELRARPLPANPPAVLLERAPGSQVLLTVFGEPGASYRIENSPSLTPVAWEPGQAVTLSSPFQQVLLDRNLLGFMRVRRE